MYVKKPASSAVQDLVAAMQAKYPAAKECAALVRLGLTAADTVCACLYTQFALYIRIYGPITSLNFTCVLDARIHYKPTMYKPCMTGIYLPSGCAHYPISLHAQHCT